MQIIDAFTKSYTNTSNYVQRMLPIMPRFVPKRYKAYEKYCGSTKLAEAGISWGKGPELIIDNLMALRGHKTAVAMFSQDLNPNAIYFDIEYADKYEAHPHRYEVAIQYLLLHEMIHWARHQDKADAKVDGKEAGNEFELEAYGQDVSYLWKLR